jgi:DNA (cytosine-5)-methyltransferase 1
MNELKYIDLFCGIGGFHQALSNLNCQCVLACDNDKSCQENYKDNYDMVPVNDVKTIDPSQVPDFDIICGGFPCFVAGTQTLTNNGYKNIEDVELRDKLLSHNGHFQRILNLQTKLYKGQLYDIKLKYHPETIVATPEHPFYTRTRVKKGVFGEPAWKTANQISKNDFVGMVINKNNKIPEFTFEKQINKSKSESVHIKLDNFDHWFLLGYFVGDGWIEETTKKDNRCMYKIRFAINNKDEEVVCEKIRKIIPITDKCCNSGKCKKYGCSDFVWYNILKHFGKYAHGKLIPEWVQDAPKEYIQEFINGYMFADGCVYKDVHQITTVSKNLAYGLQRLYLKLGHIFHVNKVDRNNKHTIENREVNQKATYMVRGILNKKRNTSSFIEGEYVWYAPSKINTHFSEDTYVYNFEVENDNSYTIENICVHNCQPFSNGGKKKTFDDSRGLLFDEIIRIAKVKKPKFMFLENVKHILKVSNGEVIKYILDTLDKNDYVVQYFQVSPHNYGVPQQRERVYFVCVRKDIYNNTPITLKPHNGSKLDFTSILDSKENIDKKYFLKGDVLQVLEAWDEMIQHFKEGEIISPTILIHDAYKNYSAEEFEALAPWRKDYMTKNKRILEKYKPQFDEWYEKHKELLSKREIYAKLEWQVGKIKPNDSIFNYFIQVRQSGIRVKKAEYFPTLVAISQIPIYGKEKRYITPRECARLQSFPDTYKIHNDDKKSYKHFGNSVNVDNVYNIISSTLENYGY